MNLDRPVTSKSRGVCRYYNTPRGCFAGHRCKFLHGEAEKHTPFDQNKVCKFYAAGYCRRGDKCWFLHTDVDRSGCPTKPAVPAESENDDVDNLCCICYETPVTYGLLAGCSHIFCVKCIREWRDPSGKSEDVVSSGNTKKCPLCRASSRFITPSSRFYSNGDPRKVALIKQYKASMARVPCRHFQKSPTSDRFCPFGRDCFYQHLNDDGTPFKFVHGVDHGMEIYKRRYLNEQFTNRSSAFGGLHWFDIEDLTVTLGALPGVIDVHSGFDDDHRDDFEGEVDRPTAQRVREMVELLDNLSDDGNTFYRFGTATPLLLEEHIEIREAGVQSAPNETHTRLQSPLNTHSSMLNSPTQTTPSLPAAQNCTDPIAFMQERSPESASAISTPLASGSPAPTTSHPRFSTVVRDRPRFFADLSNGDITQPRTPLAPIASPPNQRHFTWLADDAATHTEGLIFLQDDRAIPYAENRATEDCETTAKDAPGLEPPFQDGSSARASPLVEIPRDETTSAPPVLEALHDADPPFLTDGRGRVVWSSTTASRHREGRRGRPRAISASTQHKAQRETPEGEPALARGGESDGVQAEIRRQTLPALSALEGRPAGVGSEGRVAGSLEGGAL